MKPKTIKFFTKQDNVPEIKKRQRKVKIAPTGYISSSGNLIFPEKTMEEIGVNPHQAYFKIGMEEGKRKLKSLYLIVASKSSDTFALHKSAKGYVLPLAVILKKGSINFDLIKYDFSIHPFKYPDEGLAFQLVFGEALLKSGKTDKSRSRKKE